MPGRIIFEKLSTTSAITDIVGQRIFPVVAAQESQLPFIVYQLISLDTDDTKEDISKVDSYRYQIDCYHKEVGLNETLAATIVQTLNRYKGNHADIGYFHFRLLDLQDGIVEKTDRFRKTIEFNIRINPE